MGIASDLTNQRFGNLVANEVFQFRAPSGRSYRKWKCICDCGNQVEVKSEALKSGDTTSCGCAYQAAADKRSFGGIVQSDEYKILSQIKKRCALDNSSSKNYGARGIDVCERWLEKGFTGINNFIEDMGPRPSKEHTIERLDVNKGYYPENCIWTDDLGLQAFNRRPKNSITGIPGVTLTTDGYGYRVRISKDKKRINLGYYKDIYTAAKVRKEAEIKYYGFNLDWEMPQ